MQLDEWLFKKKITQKWFAYEIGLNSSVFQYCVAKHRKISLPVALKIIALTDGEVTFRDLLKPHEEEEINKIVPYNQPRETNE